MSKPDEETLKKAFAKFTDQMLFKYFEKYPKQGDSWQTCDIELLKDHLSKHHIHVVGSDYAIDQLAGLGLLCMFIIYRKLEGL